MIRELRSPFDMTYDSYMLSLITAVYEMQKTSGRLPWRHDVMEIQGLEVEEMVGGHSW